jgi:hypothetical protein
MLLVAFNAVDIIKQRLNDLADKLHTRAVCMRVPMAVIITESWLIHLFLVLVRALKSSYSKIRHRTLTGFCIDSALFLQPAGRVPVLGIRLKLPSAQPQTFIDSTHCKIPEID